MRSSNFNKFKAKKYGYQSSADVVESFESTDENENSRKFKASESSYLSWNTVDIEEERAYNSRSNKNFMAGSIFVNVMLNIWLLTVYFQING